MIGRTKSHSVADLTAWLKDEGQACNVKRSSSVESPEISALLARRLEYIEATEALLGWFLSEIAETRTSSRMADRSKSPTVAELTAWMEEETQACNFNHVSSWKSPERASFFARRRGYIDAATEVVGWFHESHPDKK